ncbi:MAG: hydrogenase maturation protease, partial [Candidatus Omnitrophica bacterium]|nr:hydrogenase maturation protease [Candidatus Omnitrophota bacterium]
PPPVLKELGNIIDTDFIVVGIGNELRGDDGAGIYIAAEGMKECAGKFIDAGMAIENHIFKITAINEKLVFIVDAMGGDGEAGQIKIIELDKLNSQGISTHSLSLKMIDLFFKEAGQKVYLVGIQVSDSSIGSVMCGEVRESADILIEFFINKLREFSEPSPAKAD